jgi:hypothetical protein
VAGHRGRVLDEVKPEIERSSRFGAAGVAQPLRNELPKLNRGRSECLEENLPLSSVTLRVQRKGTNAGGPNQARAERND